MPNRVGHDVEKVMFLSNAVYMLNFINLSHVFPRKCESAYENYTCFNKINDDLTPITTIKTKKSNYATYKCRSKLTGNKKLNGF